MSNKDRKLREFVSQCEKNAEAMRTSHAHPYVPAIWDQVARELERILE